MRRWMKFSAKNDNEGLSPLSKLKGGIEMKKLYENVELDFTNYYPNAGEPVIVIVDVEVEDGIAVRCIAKEDNEVFGVKAGDSFDPGELNVEDLD